MRWDLIAVGDVLLDASLPELIPGQRIHGRIELRPGGSATNVALTAAALGARSAVVGRVGADPAGRLVTDALAAAGVEPLLARDEDVATGTFVASGSAIVADPGASLRLAPEDLPPTLEAGVVLVSGYALLQAGPERAARAALELAHTRWLAVDTASARLIHAYGVERFFAVTTAADVLLANAEEARALTALDEDDAAVALATRFRVACVKLGRDGAVAASAGTVVRVRPEPLDVAPAAGAGDAFAAGFLLALVREAGLEEAVGDGCAAAIARLSRSRPSR
ncbi:MAG: carbohydrate kinase family protein [Gaiellaceae bacterium]